MVNEVSQQDCCLIQQLRFYLESAAIDQIVESADDEKIKMLYDIITEQKEKNQRKRIHITL